MASCIVSVTGYVWLNYTFSRAAARVFSLAGKKNKKAASEEVGPKSTVLISGLPESGWTESDLIKLCQPFVSAPTDIILARKLGKVGFNCWKGF